MRVPDKETAPQKRQLPGTRPTERTNTVDTRSLAHPTRAVFVDTHLCEEIAELTGIEYRALSRAFVGEEKNLALDIVKMAVEESLQVTPEEWQNHVLVWAKENSSGEYCLGYWDGYKLTYEYNDYLRSIGRL
jgi:hypothetical protein